MAEKTALKSCIDQIEYLSPCWSLVAAHRELMSGLGEVLRAFLMTVWH